eukprot:249009-Amorphochlora_amoeboformis.AAC.1
MRKKRPEDNVKRSKLKPRGRPHLCTLLRLQSSHSYGDVGSFPKSPICSTSPGCFYGSERGVRMTRVAGFQRLLQSWVSTLPRREFW